MAHIPDLRIDLEDEDRPESVDGEENKLVNIVVVDLNNRSIKLKMVQCEMIVEVREYLSEHAYTCFFTNYYLEHMG